MTEAEINKKTEEYAVKKLGEQDHEVVKINEDGVDVACILWHTSEVEQAFKDGAKWGMEQVIIEASEVIKDLLYCTDGIVTVSIPEEGRFLSIKELKARAEKFLKE